MQRYFVLNSSLSILFFSVCSLIFTPFLIVWPARYHQDTHKIRAGRKEYRALNEMGALENHEVVSSAQPFEHSKEARPSK